MIKHTQMVIAIALTSCFFTVAVQANVEKRLSRLESEMQDISVQNDLGTVGASFAPYIKADLSEWFFDAEVLLWHAKAGGVDWAILYDQALYPSKGSMYTLGFGWDWGLRVGVGRHFLHDDWDVGILYTYFTTQDSSKINVGFQTPSISDGSSSAESSFGTSQGSFSTKYRYNALDLGLGKAYFLSKELLVHPHIGVKNIWLTQKYRLYTNDFINALNSVFAVSGVESALVKDRNVVWGIGPHIGVDSSWNLRCGLKFVSALETALLQSYLNIEQKETIYIAPVGSAPINTALKIKGSMHRFVPYARLAFGLGWGKNLEDNKHIDVSIAYEANYFWRVDQTLNDINTDPSVSEFGATDSVRTLFYRSSEDICFYGVTGRIKLDF